MKRLTSLAISILTFAILSVPVSAAPQRFWKVNMSKPSAETISRTIKVNYNVQSTIASDTFAVTLYENGVAKANQNVTTDYGDSGVFTIDIPATGNYSYQVKATNNEAGESKTSNSSDVKVVNEPENIVVTVNQNPTDGQVVTAATNGPEAEGQVAADQNDAESKDSSESKDTSKDSDTEDGDVLGDEKITDKLSDGAPYVAIPLAIGLLAYMFYRARQSVED